MPAVRATYLDLLRGFVAAQRDHIHREEAGFLPAARRLLKEKDWQELDGIVAGVMDPLADPADVRFRALRRQLAEASQTVEQNRQANIGL